MIKYAENSIKTKAEFLPKKRGRKFSAIKRIPRG